MKDSLQKFQTLPLKEKKELLLLVQGLLLKFHPESRFLITKENLGKQKEFFMKFFTQYKGHVYYTDDIVVFYNKIFVDDPKDLNRLVKKNVFAESAENYNGVSIDFAVFKDYHLAKNFYLKADEPQIQYVLFVKNNQPSLHLKEKLLRGVKFL